jgi:hypothetical protein
MECNMVRMVISFSPHKMCCGKNGLVSVWMECAVSSKWIVTACLECIISKKVRLGMEGKCCGQNCQLQECVMVKIVSFSMYGMCLVKNYSVSACLGCIAVKIVSFSMAGRNSFLVKMDNYSMYGFYYVKNNLFQHGWD